MSLLFILACLTPLPIELTSGDRDGDGVGLAQDCDDNNPGRFPGNPEICDGRDQDCDEAIDEGVLLVGYVDADGDGVGAGDGIELCDVLGQGLVFDGNDCDDGDIGTFPGAAEFCDEVDNDCDDRVDEGVQYVDYYRDADGDGYGDETNHRRLCGEVQSGWVQDDQDCDDTDAGVNPGAPELCDGLDQDCSGEGPDSVEECSCEVLKVEGNHYLYCGDYLSWFNARSVCAAMSTDLITVSGFIHNKAISSISESYEAELWTGMSDYADEGNWSWADGSPVSYTNWGPGEPNNTGNNEDCMEIGYFAGGLWNDDKCSEQHPFVCTYNGLAPE